MAKTHRPVGKKADIEQEEISIDILSFLKKHWPLLLVLAFAGYGLMLRLYHIDYPVIGYHNWKEVRYLAPARHFAEDGFFKHGFFIPEGDFINLKDNPRGAHGDYFPFSSIFGAITMMLFGTHLWAARLPGVLMSTGTVIIMYLLVKELFGRKDIAMIAAFLMAINPLSVFQSHNVQQMTPAFFFMLLGLWFYFIWINRYRNQDLVLSALFIILSIITKYEYGIIILPMLIAYPFERLRNIRKDHKAYIACAAIVLLGLAWHYYSTDYILRELGTYSGTIDYATIDPKPMFDPSFWMVMKDFAADNFTLLSIVFSVIGLAFAVIFFKLKNLSSRFMLGYFAGSVAYFLMIPANLKGHNYHQYPLAALVIILTAYFMLIISVNAAKMVGSMLGKTDKNAEAAVKVLVIAMLVFLLFKPSLVPFFGSFNSRGGTMPYGGVKESIDRMFDTQFFGLDIAGEYINEHKDEDDWIMHSQHQAFGILWHANTKSPKGIYRDVDSISYAEDVLNASWLFIYQWDFNIFQEEIWDYYAENYEPVQVGMFMRGQDQPPEIKYILLRREHTNATFDLDRLGEYLAGKPLMFREYELTGGRIQMAYIDV